MRATRVKQLRRELFKQWPMLLAQHGRRLKPFSSVFRIIKKSYKEKFAQGGYKLARTRCKT